MTMKTLLYSAFFLLFSNRMMAQNNIHIGIKGGVNFSNVYDSDGNQFDADGKAGFVGGGYLSIPLGKFLAVQPEVLYSQKGFKATGNFLGSNYQYKRTTSFIDVPLMIALKPASNFAILFGPQYSFLVHQRNEFTTSTTSAVQEQSFNNDNVRKNIFGLIGGIDFNLKNAIVGARLGGDVQTNNGDGTSSTPRYKNVWFQLTLGFQIL